MPPGNEKMSGMSRWMPLAAWMVLISLFSTDQFSNSNTGGILEPVLRFILGNSFNDELFEIIHYLIRKSAHITEYAVLGVLWFRALNPGLFGWSRRTAITAFSLSVFYASLDEFHQTFTLSRGGSPVDVIIDSSGALVALAAIWFYNKGLTRSEK